MKTPSILLLALVASAFVITTVKADDFTKIRGEETLARLKAATDTGDYVKSPFDEGQKRALEKYEKWREVIHKWEIGQTKKGKAEFRDANGNVITYDPATDTLSEEHIDRKEATLVKKEFQVPHTIIEKDGTIKTLYKSEEVWIDTFYYEQTLKRVIPKTIRVESVVTVLENFYKTFKDITEEEYKLVGMIVATDHNRYWSDYIYWEVRDKDIHTAILKINDIFVAKMDDAYLMHLADEITQCKGENQYIEKEFITNHVDINNKDGWTINYQYFASTCSDESDRNQFFAWVGSKSGIYLPGQYGEDNAVLVSGIMKTWLKTHIVNLIRCDGSESSSSSSSTHTKPSPKPDYTETTTHHEGTNHADAAGANASTPEGSVTVTVTSTSTAGNNSGSGSASMNGSGSSGKKTLSMGN